MSRGAAALFCVILLQAGGCRDTGTGPVAQSPVTALAFAAGDSLVFDAWVVDSYGYAIPSTHTTPIWVVLSIGGTYAGAAGVTSIAELPGPGAPPSAIDTLHFRFLPSGDIEQYGFIARVVRRREHLRLPPSWDRIAAFSLPTNSTWTVGTVDSAGTDTLRGTVIGDQGYFVASLDDVRTAFHGYGVSLSSLDIVSTLVVSDSPAAILFAEEEGTFLADGMLRTLVALNRH
jgi:hypothetical protein